MIAAFWVGAGLGVMCEGDDLEAKTTLAIITVIQVLSIIALAICG